MSAETITLKRDRREKHAPDKSLNSFLIRCPSSKKRDLQTIPRSTAFIPDLTESYVVTTTWVRFGLQTMVLSRACSLRSLECNRWTLSEGHQRFSSLIQLKRTERGTTMRWGPGCFLTCMMWAIKEMHWSVLPGKGKFGKQRSIKIMHVMLWASDGTGELSWQ